MRRRWSLLLAGMLGFLSASAGGQPDNQILFELTPTAAVPRNSEGAFAALPGGRIIFCYTQYRDGDLDHSAARIVGIHSDDQGLTWSEPREIVPSRADGLNVMSVSLVPLADGRLALFYLFTRDVEDCRPYLILSGDEGKTWSAPRVLIDTPGYYILNNDRVILTSRGRLIMPMNLHRRAGTRGLAVWYYSDDAGATWQESLSRWGTTDGESGFQESGVVELADGGLLSWARTDLGAQYESRSEDHGVTWSAPRASSLRSPLSAASIKRLPGSTELLALYNDHSGQFPFVAGRRSPLVAALSADDGLTWPRRRLVEPDTDNWYHYIALHFATDGVLLAYNAGNDRMAKLSSPLRIRRLAYSWLPARREP